MLLLTLPLVFKHGIGNFPHVDHVPTLICALITPFFSLPNLQNVPKLAREAPTIEIYPREPQTVRVGESAMLSCRAIAGIPSPTVVWTRRDQSPLSHRIKEEYPGTIVINDITLGESGEYECKASNVAGESTQTASVTVFQPPVIHVTPEQTELTITEGDELKIECTAEGLPSPTVTWKTPNQIEATLGLPGYDPYSRSLAQAIVHKYNVNRGDEGTYVCQASNDAGSDEKYIYVIVQPKRGDVGKFAFNSLYTNEGALRLLD